MSVFYIDVNSVGGDGSSPERAARSCTEIELKPGDRVLFRRGTTLPAPIVLISGSDDAPIYYGAYGDGDLPTFCGSTDASSPEDWIKTDRENIWRCIKPIPGDVGNLVFDGDDASAALVWEKDGLSNDGEFYDSRFGQGEQNKRQYGEQELLLYSHGNPADVHRSVECISYNTRQLGKLRANVVIEGLRFCNSGVHGLAGSGDNITIRGCEFLNIGGCAWDRSEHIRFGNAIEIWKQGNDITVENCLFKNIYDSCITHQGPGERTLTSERFICRNNHFENYGMAAFEYRDKLPIAAEFVGNTCIGAGVGFAMLGETLPRRSEIWPQPMGHHIFLWRIDSATDGGSITIKDNDFGPAPVGAAIYSIISPDAEAQITLENNRYTPNDTLLIRFKGRNFNDIEEFRRATGHEMN